MSTSQLYFLAIIPPEPLLPLLWELKHEVARKFASSAALRSPPHITLHMPFKMKEKKRDALISGINQLTGKLTPLRVELDGFDSFPPKVIYIKVEASQELIKVQQAIASFMAKKMSILNASYKKQPFKPHLTIAFRDLKKAEYHKAWDYYRERPFKTACLVDHIALLKHDGKRWEEDVKFRLGK